MPARRIGDSLRGVGGARRPPQSEPENQPCSCRDPTEAEWLAPIAMTLLWTAVRRTTLRSAALIGLCFGIPFFGLLLWWLLASIGWFAWVALCSTGGAATAVATM
ncbi:hypothetical protein [Aeromicrobium sp. Sec7.5]|uniref:hypothetical protein n=1 Tax=Aeromicrobium sp. Sec7.5 TaxID=3121276 RepID=UPI003FA589F7